MRLAPTASRTAISFWRPDARASSMLATFAHAMSSTRPTITISTPAIGTTSRSAAGCRCTSLVAFTATRRSLLVAGFAASICAISSARFAPACSTVRPGFNRPRMNSHRSPRRSSRVVPPGDGTTSCMPTGSTVREAAAGTQTSGARIGVMPVKPRGATPTIV